MLTRSDLRLEDLEKSSYIFNGTNIVTTLAHLILNGFNTMNAIVYWCNLFLVLRNHHNPMENC